MAVFAEFQEDEAVGVITSLVRRTHPVRWCQSDSYLISAGLIYA